MMKRILLLLFLASCLGLQFCSTTKSAAGKKMEPKVSYTADVAPILKERCTPCHFPDGGKKKFLDTYAAVRDNFDDILHRVELSPDADGFMPFKSKKPPLSDSLVAVLKVWKETGMSE